MPSWFTKMALFLAQFSDHYTDPYICCECEKLRDGWRKWRRDGYLCRECYYKHIQLGDLSAESDEENSG
jgi:hypothetical protein